jgi:hypothetical protein
MNELKFPLIPMSEIRPEIREIAVVWAGEAGMGWIGDKHKLASDIQNYADWYANKQHQPNHSDQGQP